MFSSQGEHILNSLFDKLNTIFLMFNSIINLVHLSQGVESWYSNLELHLTTYNVVLENNFLVSLLSDFYITTMFSKCIGVARVI